LSSLLRSLGLAVEDEYEVGPYTVDCYLEEVHAAVEYDGRDWHHGSTAKSRKDTERDALLLSVAGVAVLRVRDDEVTASNLGNLKDRITAFVDECGEDVEVRRVRWVSGWME